MKPSFPRRGLVREWDTLDTLGYFCGHRICRWYPLTKRRDTVISVNELLAVRRIWPQSLARSGVSFAPFTYRSSYRPTGNFIAPRSRCLSGTIRS
jgi:hypothetical protein